MTVQGQGESQPGEGVATLESLANQLDVSEQDAPEESEEGEAPEEAEEIEAEEQEADDSEEASGEEPKFTIKVDGKDVVLTQAELIERAQKGTDYTQKTMEVAEKRKAVEAEISKAAEYRQRMEQAEAETLNRLQAYTKVVESQLGQMPDSAMLDYDTAGYLRQKEQFEARRGQLQQAYSEIQQIQNEQARKRQAWFTETAEAAEKHLRDTLPGWNDDMLADLNGYVGKLGLTPEAARLGMLAPGFWQMAHKAKAYDQLQAKKAEMKPVSQLPKVHKPTANNQPPQLAKQQDAMKRHKAAPSLKTLADLL